MKNKIQKNLEVPKKTTTEKIAHVVKEAKSVGLCSFFLAVKDGSMITYQYENIPMKDAMEIIIGAFHQTVNIELERHPEYKGPKKDLLLGLLTGFDTLIKHTNNRMIELAAQKIK